MHLAPPYTRPLMDSRRTIWGALLVGTGVAVTATTYTTGALLLPLLGGVVLLVGLWILLVR